MFRGCNRDGIKAASIYISCRLNGCTRTPHEIAEIFNLDNTSATHGCSLALEILNNVQRNNGLEVTNLGVTLPSAFIERYCSKLNINKDQTMLCKFIANKVEKANIIQDNTPHSIAAGIIYFVCQSFNLSQTKGDIAIVCKVSEVTISKCFRKLETVKGELIPPCVMKKFSENK
jgi:transcription initiation factor TFIIB